MNARLAALASMLLATGCPSGERCDPSTYAKGCDGKSGWTYCSAKTHTGAKKLWPTVTRIDCEARTECVEEAEISTCVAAPAERCEVLDAVRCVDGLRQHCWEPGSRGITQVRYWYPSGLSCDGSETH